MSESQARTEGEAPQAQFSIQRIYVKDLSFESPNAPKVFTQSWKPEVGLEVNTRTRSVGEHLYEAVLTLTVTTKSEDETAFLIEVQQAGLFAIKGLEEAQLQHTLGAFCPNLLFPYAREAVDNLALRGGFPALGLAPVNFEALYADQVKKKASAQEEASSTQH